MRCCLGIKSIHQKELLIAINNANNHPFNHLFSTPLILLGQKKPGVFYRRLWAQGEYTLDRMPVYCRTQSHTHLDSRGMGRTCSNANMMVLNNPLLNSQFMVNSAGQYHINYICCYFNYTNYKNVGRVLESSESGRHMRTKYLHHNSS